MGVSLVPATDADVADYLIDARDSYLANLVEAGLPPSVAERTADEALVQSFPGGRPAAGHRVFCVEHGGEKAGLLWIGPQSTEQPDRWWVWDIVISKAFRGQGLGRQVMLLAEIEARAQGAAKHKPAISPIPSQLCGPPPSITTTACCWRGFSSACAYRTPHVSPRHCTAPSSFRRDVHPVRYRPASPPVAPQRRRQQRTSRCPVRTPYSLAVPDQQTDRWTFTPTTWPRANR